MADDYLLEILRRRFMQHVHVFDTGDECWYWTGTVTKNGYGEVNWDRKKQGAHRVAYKLFVGSIPAQMQIDHLCHTASPNCPGNQYCPHRRCVKPEHLEPVTPGENNDRRWKRTRVYHGWTGIKK